MTPDTQLTHPCTHQATRDIAAGMSGLPRGSR